MTALHNCVLTLISVRPHAQSSVLAKERRLSIYNVFSQWLESSQAQIKTETSIITRI